MQPRRVQKNKENDRRLSNGDAAPPAVSKNPRLRSTRGKRKEPPVVEVPSPKRSARATRITSTPSPQDICDMDEDPRGLEGAEDLKYAEALLRVAGSRQAKGNKKRKNESVEDSFLDSLPPQKLQSPRPSPPDPMYITSASVLSEAVHAVTLDDAVLDSFKPSPSPFKPSHQLQGFKQVTFDTNLEHVQMFSPADVGELMTAKHGGAGGVTHTDDDTEAYTEASLQRWAILEGFEVTMHGFHDGVFRNFGTESEKELDEAKKFEAFETAKHANEYGTEFVTKYAVGAAVVDHDTLMDALADSTFDLNPKIVELERDQYVVQ